MCVLLRIRAVPRTELLEDALVGNVAPHVLLGRQPDEQVDHLLLGELVVILDDPDDHRVQVRRREVHLLQHGKVAEDLNIIEKITEKTIFPVFKP